MRPIGTMTIIQKRDDFAHKTKLALAHRVGMHCSNPNCAKLTAGPQKDPEKALNVGVAAHIAAASVGGVRYDETMTPTQRRSIDNGIWLCQTCAKLVDNDAERYTVDLLRKWRFVAEESARRRVEGAGARIGRRTRYYVVTLTDEEHHLEKIPCPTCGEVVTLDMSILPGASGSPMCTKCGFFHASRDRDGEILTRKWGGSVHKDSVTCPKCSNQLQVRGDKKALSKPCLDCESILRINMGQVVSVSPMKSIDAASFAKEGWKQLLLCPNCQVRGITLGMNKHDMLFAQCPKCRYFLKFPKPAEAMPAEREEGS
jgi:predicted RNA-binding Zn-ribbon protein involved in translation (DUF1610 family)/uncharacterized protein YbaR (Trm112 family)